jgi:hypothetical protein
MISIWQTAREKQQHLPSVHFQSTHKLLEVSSTPVFEALLQQLVLLLQLLLCKGLSCHHVSLNRLSRYMAKMPTIINYLLSSATLFL